jgi:formylmethanofuran--tetrahydromethanopterin N-formyltransferase
VHAIAELEGTIKPFPEGNVASGSKSEANKYKFLKFTTTRNFATPKNKIENTGIPADVNSVYEIVIIGLIKK